MKWYIITVISRDGKKTIKRKMSEETASRYSDSLALQKARMIAEGYDETFTYTIEEVNK